MEPSQQSEQSTPVPSPVNEPQLSVPGQPTQTPTSNDPGKTLGIVSLVLPFVGLGLIGLIVGIISRRKSKSAGYSNGFALAGIIVSVISIVVSTLIVGLLTVGILQANKKCQELGPGTHIDGTTTITCGSSSSNQNLNAIPGSTELDDF